MCRKCHGSGGAGGSEGIRRIGRRGALALGAAAGGAGLLSAAGIGYAQAPPGGGPVFTAAAPVPRVRGRPDPGIDPSQVTLPQQVLGWSDGTGWERPACYLTIRFGDIGKDHQMAMVGRGPDGLQTWTWDTSSNLWRRRGAALADLSDKGGWDQPEYYSTIQLADLDGDGQAALIARYSSGLQVFRWDDASESWGKVGGAFETFSDVGGWTDPSYYSTFRFADVDGDKRQELVVRTASGIVVWRWSGSTWTLAGDIPAPDSFAGFFVNANGWDNPDQYTTIQLGDIDGNGRAELLGRWNEGLWTLRWNTAGALWEPMDDSPGFIDYDFSDSNGWDKPERYTTIQLADIDGDGRAELLARTTDAVGAWKWLAPSGEALQWVPYSNGIPSTDAGGWNQPQYYTTIQAADVDGDGQAEVIARAGAGLGVWHFTPSPTRVDPGTFALLGTYGPAMADAAGWGAPRRYLTIQTADVDGDGHFEVMGRASDGVHTWKWTAGGPGFVQPPVAGFPAYGGGQLTAYRLLSQYLLSQPVEGSPWPPAAAAPSPAYQDVRAQYTNQELVGEWLGFRQAVAALRGQPPPGVAAADFEAVRQQLQTELAYVQFANLWFGNLRAFLTELFDEDQMSVELVADYLSLSTTSTASVVLEVLELLVEFIAGILGVIAGAATAGTALAAVTAIGDAIAGLLATAFSAAAAGIGGGSGLQLQVAHLQGELLETREHALRGNDLTQAAFLSHWPLLRALGQPIAALQVTWPLGQADAWAAGARRGYERYLWKTLAPVKWGVTTSWDWTLGPPDSERYDYVLWWNTDNSCGVDNQPYAWVYVDHYDDAPARAALERLFDQPAPGDLAGPLGVSLNAVMNGYDGWNLPGALGFGHCAPPLPQPLPPDPVTFWHPHRNPPPTRR